MSNRAISKAPENNSHYAGSIKVEIRGMDGAVLQTINVAKDSWWVITTGTIGVKSANMFGTTASVAIGPPKKPAPAASSPPSSAAVARSAKP